MTTKQEQWKEVPGYEGQYCVSSIGRVYSIERSVEDSRGRTYKIPGRILKQRKNIDGYMIVGLAKDGKQIVYRVHRLVAAAFLNMPIRTGIEATVNHINGIKTDNQVSNLEVVSQRENNIHAVNTNLVNHNGEHNGRAKLTASQVAEIRYLATQDKKSNGKQSHGFFTKISKRFRICQTSVKRIVEHKQWTN